MNNPEFNNRNFLERVKIALENYSEMINSEIESLRDTDDNLIEYYETELLEVQELITHFES